MLGNLNDMILFLRENGYVDEISPETRLYEDLKIYGDDAVNLIEKFSTHFKVNISNFIYSKYFYNESHIIFPDFVRKLFGLTKEPKPSIRIKDLLKAIEKGELNDDVIMPSR